MTSLLFIFVFSLSMFSLGAFLASSVNRDEKERLIARLMELQEQIKKLEK